MPHDKAIQERITELKSDNSKHQLAVKLAELEAGKEMRGKKPPDGEPQTQLVSQQATRHELANQRAQERRVTKPIAPNSLSANGDYKQGWLDAWQVIEITKPMNRAMWELLSFAPSIAVFLSNPDKRFITAIMQGKSQELSSWLQGYINTSNALLEWGGFNPDAKYRQKRREFIELQGLLAESIGRIETAPNERAFKQAVEDTLENVKPLTGSIYEELAEVERNIDKGGRPANTHRAYRRVLADEYQTEYELHGDSLNRNDAAPRILRRLQGFCADGRATAAQKKALKEVEKRPYEKRPNFVYKCWYDLY